MARRYLELTDERQGLESLVQESLDEDRPEPELAEAAREELIRVEGELQDIISRYTSNSVHGAGASVPGTDPDDDRDIFVEIRPGAGGAEASLFTRELFRAYSRYARTCGWRVEPADISQSGGGPIGTDRANKIFFQVQGRGSFSRFKFESGVHRVQRVPETEAQGRLHTSTVTVAVLPQPDELELRIDPEDIRIDFYRAGGHGGQAVNKQETAVRIVHKPTGLVVTCQDERRQGQNRERAMAVLRARLYEMERARREAELAEKRRSQVGSGRRSEKARTYNFPQDRITDHRTGRSFHNIARFMDGEFDAFIDTLTGALTQSDNA